MKKKGINKHNRKYEKYYENKIKDINIDYTLPANKTIFKGRKPLARISVVRAIALFTKKNSKDLTQECRDGIRSSLSILVDTIELQTTNIERSNDAPNGALGVVIVVRYEDVGQLLENIKLVVDTTEEILKLEQLELCSGTAVEIRK